MYAKLALRNIKKSIRDYIIYFVTVTQTAAFMYSFLALGFSEDILSMSENMTMLTSGILWLSVLVAFTASFVIGYAVHFMLAQRKKEFGTYGLLGMETMSVQKLFFIENGIIGIFAFLSGTLAGTALSGLLVQLVNQIFDTPHSYRLSFSLKAFLTALLLFGIMYGFGIFRAVRIIRKRSIADLLYDNRKHWLYLPFYICFTTGRLIPFSDARYFKNMRRRAHIKTECSFPLNTQTLHSVILLCYMF